MIIAVAGHVDHGKTQLTKALTGVETDRLIEEKARGLSIDLGFAYERLPDGGTIGFVDVPGHEKFIHNMLSGVAGIDLGLLVVATDDGVMPQTREHLAILKLLGIDRFVVALTKIDRVSSERVFEVRGAVTQLFKETRITQISFHEVCAIENVGIQALKATLFESAGQTKLKETNHYFRMAIDRSFNLKGTGLIVTGMVFSGSTDLSRHLTVSSNGTQVRVRAIRANNQKTDQARVGERCAFNITGRNVSKNCVPRGSWLLHSKLYVPTRRVDVELHILNTESKSLKHWTSTYLHIGADHLLTRVAILEGGKIAPGESGLAQLVVARDIFAVHGDHFIIRDQSAQRTIGGGSIIDPYSPHRGRSRPSRLVNLKSMIFNSPKHILKSMAGKSITGVQLSTFSITHNIPTYYLDKLVNSLGLRRVGKAPYELVFSSERWCELLDIIVNTTRAFHLSKPDLLGLTIKDLQLLIKPFLQYEILKIALDSLVEQKKLFCRESRFHLGWHQSKPSISDNAILTKVLGILSQNSGSPLTISDTAKHIGVERSVIEKILKIGIKLGVLVQVGKNRYVSTELLDKLKASAEKMSLVSADGQFTTIAYRDEINMGRNFAIVILEYFDRTGFTVRVGDYRRLNGHSSKTDS